MKDRYAEITIRLENRYNRGNSYVITLMDVSDKKTDNFTYFSCPRYVINIPNKVMKWKKSLMYKRYGTTIPYEYRYAPKEIVKLFKDNVTAEQIVELAQIILDPKTSPHTKMFYRRIMDLLDD